MGNLANGGLLELPPIARPLLRSQILALRSPIASTRQAIWPEDSRNRFHFSRFTGGTWSAGRNGPAMFFDGVDDSWQTPHSALMNAASQTWEVWYKARRIPTYGVSNIVFVFTKMPDTGNSREFSLFLQENAVPNNGWALGIGNAAASTNYQITETRPSRINSWEHVIGLKRQLSGNNYEIELWVNGVRVATTTRTDGAFQGTTPVALGGLADGGSSGSRNAEGWIDEANIYNRALNAGEITYLWQSGRQQYRRA